MLAGPAARCGAALGPGRRHCAAATAGCRCRRAPWLPGAADGASPQTFRLHLSPRRTRGHSAPNKCGFCPPSKSSVGEQLSHSSPDSRPVAPTCSATGSHAALPGCPAFSFQLGDPLRPTERARARRGHEPGVSVTLKSAGRPAPRRHQALASPDRGCVPCEHDAKQSPVWAK